ncbi:MAG: lipase class 2 [Thermoleophilia bacterium]|nr:lipase class 2 [Thermoleophilia bacterium]
MGIYENGVRTAWTGLMKHVERNVAKVDALGTPLAKPAVDAPPVLLVHGYGNTSTAMGAIERSLTRDGFRAFHVDLPNRGFDDAVADAAFVNAEVNRIRLVTGSRTVDAVGHSRGGLVARTWQQKFQAPGSNGRVVTVSSANTGLHLGPMDRVVGGALPEGMQQIRRGTELIDDLARTRRGSDQVAVGTNGVDGILLPANSAKIEGAPFIAVDEGRTIGPMSRVTHYGILTDDAAYEAIRGALLRPRS